MSITDFLRLDSLPTNLVRAFNAILKSVSSLGGATASCGIEPTLGLVVGIAGGISGAPPAEAGDCWSRTLAEIPLLANAACNAPPPPIAEPNAVIFYIK